MTAAARPQGEDFDFRSIIEDVEQGIIIHAADGTMLYANATAKAILGHIDEPLEGLNQPRPGVQLIDDDGRALSWPEHPAMRVLRDGVAITGSLLGLRYDDGHETWLSVSARPRYAEGSAEVVGVIATIADITEQHRLRDAEAHARAIIESSGEAVVTVTPRGVVTGWNQAAERLTGASTASRLAACLPAASVAALVDARRQLAGGEPSVHTVLRVERTDGRWVDLYAQITATRSGGVPVEYSIVLRDVTHSEAHSRLRELRSAVSRVLACRHPLDEAIPTMLRLMCEHLQFASGNYWAAAEGQINRAASWPPYAGEGPATTAATGLPARGLDSTDAFVLDHTARATFAPGTSPTTCEALVIPVRGDGTRARAMIVLERVQPGPIPADLLPALTDLGQQIGMAIEKGVIVLALERSQSRYHEIVENTADIVYELNLDGRVASLNHAWERLSGYSVAETLGRSAGDFTAPGEFARMMAFEQRRLRGQRDLVYEATILARDGHPIVLELKSSWVFEGGKPVRIQGIAREVGERRALEQRLRQAQKMEAVGRLAAGVAHDFNNALAVISGYSDLLVGSLTDPDLQDDGQELLAAVRRAAGITRQLLAIGRQQALGGERMDLNTAVDDLVRMLRRLVGDEVEIVLGLCAEPLPIDADRGHLAQILLNLVANARDAMPQGGTVTISTERAGTDAPAAVLRIADTGTGMDAETRSHMFEPFFTTKPTGKGTGLGLATSYGFVQGMGGAMGVESEVGSGSVFTISLPLAAGEEHRGSGDEEAPHPGLLGGGTTSILLVEDQEPVRAMTRRLLEQAGYLVTDIGDPVAVLDLDDRALGPFHLMLTDVSMPVLSGLQLAHQVRKRRPDLPTLFMSGYNNERLEEHYGLTGQPVLQKPFDRQALLSAVSAALGR